MADDKNEHVENKSDSQPEQTPLSDGSQPSDDGWKSLAQEAGLNPDELGSKEAFIKTYTESRKGLSEQGEKIKEYEQSIARVTPVLQVINKDPELFKRVKAALEGKQETEDESDKDTQTPPKDPRVDDLVSDKQSQVVSDIEKSFGVHDMKDEEAREARRKVGEKLKTWGITNENLPSVSKLRDIMADAYVASGYKQNDQESSPSAGAGFGTPRSAIISPESITADTLSPDEKKAAEKMGMSYDEYAKSKREIYT